MGIDAQAVSSLLPRRWYQRSSGPKTLRAIEIAAQSWASKLGLGPLYQSSVASDGSLELFLIPVADALQITFAHDRLSVGFRSSNDGPGFHAAAVDLLDHIASSMLITWQWRGSDGTDFDETGYATHRDIAILQSKMALFLADLCSTVPSCKDSDDPSRSSTFCLPLGLGQFADLIACPLGPMPLDWAAKVLSLDDAALLNEASRFFIWWDQGLEGKTWAQLLRAQLWQTAQWRPPVSREDELIQAQIMHSYARMRALGTTPPPDLEQAYQQYLACQTDDTPPPAEGMGYRKYLVWSQLYQSWALSVPGYLVLTDEGEKVSFEHPAFWLGVTALSSQHQTAQDAVYVWPDSFDGPITEIRPGLNYRKSHRKNSVGSSVQGAIICSIRQHHHQLLLLTLSSHLDWPFQQFDLWVNTVSCPDLPTEPHSVDTQRLQ